MKTAIRGINYTPSKRGYYVRKNSIYIGFFFYFEDAKRALEDFLYHLDN